MRNILSDTITYKQKHRRIIIPYIYTMLERSVCCRRAADNRTILSIYRMCVNARVSFQLLVCTTLVMRKYEENVTCSTRCSTKCDTNNLNSKNKSISNTNKYSNNHCNSNTNTNNYTNSNTLSNPLILFTVSLIITSKYLLDHNYSNTDYFNLLCKMNYLSIKNCRSLRILERKLLHGINYVIDIEEAMVVREAKGWKRGIVEWVLYVIGCDG